MTSEYSHMVVNKAAKKFINSHGTICVEAFEGKTFVVYQLKPLCRENFAICRHKLLVCLHYMRILDHAEIRIKFERLIRAVIDMSCEP